MQLCLGCEILSSSVQNFASLDKWEEFRDERSFIYLFLVFGFHHPGELERLLILLTLLCRGYDGIGLLSFSPFWGVDRAIVLHMYSSLFFR